MELLKFSRYIKKVVPHLSKIVVSENTLVLYLNDSNKIVTTLCFLRDHFNLKFTCLLDIWGVDYPDRTDRFEVNYLLLSVRYNIRVIVRVQVRDSVGIPSVESVFSSSGWLEREVWDMFGIIFYKNKDLRRILTDYGFEGFPLRKDFPLSGFVEVRYDDSEKRVLQEPLEVSQEYRAFNFKSPWEN